MEYAIITGASKGIGKAIAYELAKKGFHLILTGRNQFDLKALAENLSREFSVDVRFVGIDLGEANGPQKLFDWVIDQKVDVRILVNNAGFGLAGPIENYSLNDYAEMVQLNCTSVVHLCQLFYPALIGKGEAYILNIASTSSYQPVPYLTVYAATKSFLLSFSRSINREWRHRGLSVTVASPGPTITHFNERAKVEGKVAKRITALSMKAEDVAKVAVKAMFKRKTEKVIGLINQIGAYSVRFFPKNWVEKLAIQLYK